MLSAEERRGTRPDGSILEQRSASPRYTRLRRRNDSRASMSDVLQNKTEIDSASVWRFDRALVPSAFRMAELVYRAMLSVSGARRWACSS